MHIFVSKSSFLKKSGRLNNKLLSVVTMSIGNTLQGENTDQLFRSEM